MFAKSAIKTDEKQIKSKERFSEFRNLESEKPKTLKLDPPSMIHNLEDTSNFNYNLHPISDDEKYNAIQPRQIETLQGLPEQFSNSQKSIFISYDSMYNSDNESQNFDSKIDIKQGHSKNSSHISYQSKRNKKTSNFMGEKINTNKRFNSDFYFMKNRNKLKSNTVLPKNKQKNNLFGSTVIEENSIFDTNDKDYKLFSNTNDSVKLNKFVLDNDHSEKHTSMMVMRHCVTWEWQSLYQLCLYSFCCHL